MDQEEKQRNYALAEKLLAEQNLVAATVFGALAMILAAGFYGVIGSGGATYSFMSAGIGLAVGLTMQFLGRGIDYRFPLVASILALIGCLLGNMFTLVIYVARSNMVSPFKTLAETPLDVLVGWAVSGVQLISLFFWMMSMVTAIYFAKRSLTREERLAIGLYEMRAGRHQAPS